MLTHQDMADILRKAANWKGPGPEKVHNYWLKKFRCLHQRLAELIKEVVFEPQELPLFPTLGVTYLLHKDPNNLQDPSKWHPTTCLPTTYEVITSGIAACIDRHCDQNNIIAEQQKGCRKGA